MGSNASARPATAAPLVTTLPPVPRPGRQATTATPRIAHRASPITVQARICLFTDSLQPSGVGEHMLLLAGQLRERFDVSFVCPPNRAGRGLLERAEAMGLATLPLSVRGWQTRERGRLAAWLRDERIDLFHAHAGIGWECHAGIEAARRAGTRAVVVTHHLPDLIRDPRQREQFDREMTKVDRMICVSEGVRASFAHWGSPREKLRAVRNGITPRPTDADRAAVRAGLGLPADARLLLTVGRLNEQKGLTYLIDAMATVAREHGDVYALAAGDGPLLPQLRAQARQRGIARQVRLLGKRQDVGDLLAAADLFVLPSLFEGLPLVILEAMAAGLPVIATDVCGTSEVIEDGVSGRLVPPENPAALAGAILAALARPEQTAAWAAAAVRRAFGEFSVARMARETAAIYDELLAAAPPPRHNGPQPSS